MSIEYTGVGGARKEYGPSVPYSAAPASLTVFGKRRELVINFDYRAVPGVPTASTAKDAVVQVIPEGAYIESALYHGDIAAAGGTVSVGTYDADGNAIVAAGLFAAATALGTGWTAGAGSQVGAGLAKDAYVVVTPSATLTAGAGTFIIRYVVA